MRHTHRVQKQASFSHLGQFKLPKLPNDQQWLFWKLAQYYLTHERHTNFREANAVRYGTAKGEWFLNVVSDLKVLDTIRM